MSSAPLVTPDPKTRGAEMAVDALVELGADTFFGIPGGPIIPLFDAILTHPGARLVEPRHEASASFLAMGWHRATGRVPVVVVTAGPGATNVVTGVVAAALERVPMLVICGDVAWGSTGRRLLQDTGEASIGIERMLGHVARATIRASRPQSVASQAIAAYRAATDPYRPGPALLVLPIDHAGAVVEHRSVTRSGVRPRVAGKPEDSWLAEVEGKLRTASRPWLLLGAGCRGAEGEVRDLVDALGVPFATTPQAKGIVPETHPLSLRTTGMAGSQWARRYGRAGPDAALVLGTDLDDVSTAGTPPIGPNGWLAHVDLDASVLGRNFPTGLGVVCDVGAFAAALTERAARRPIGKGARLAAAARRESAYDVPEFATDSSVPIAPHRVIADLQAAAPDGTRFVTDIGEHMLFALHYLTAEASDSFEIHLGLGCMGSGIASAVGLALGDPTRLVVCVAGDGGMQMLGAEILTAVKHKLPLVYAVFNDARYNMVYHGYRQTFGREAAWETPPVDFAAWARAMSARGARIDEPGQIDRALLCSALAEGPLVLDIRQDASIRIRGEGRIEAIRQMSLLQSGGE